MSDYLLNKIYESILQNKPFKDKNFKTLAESYNIVYEQETEQQITPVIKKNIKRERKPSGPINSTPDYINSILSKALADKQITQIPPVGDYKLDNFKVLPEDMPAFKILFTESPPTLAGVPQSRGSGKGELALFWLLSKKNNVQDTRSEGQPDLTVNGEGVEVKAYESNEMGLGRFGEQYDNRTLLSILFGLKAILNLSDTAASPTRPPSLDTFNKEELINAFQAVINLNNIKELKALSSTYPPIAALYKQIDFLLTSLQLQNNDFEAKDGAAKMLITILKTKLKDKPGFPGYIANCFKSGDIKIYPVNEQHLDSLNPDIILNNVKANGAAIIIKPGPLFLGTRQ